MPRREEDKALYVKFEQRGVYNKAKSDGEVVMHNDGHILSETKGAGHAIHDDVDYVTIVCASDSTSIPVRPAMYCDRRLLEADAPALPCRAVRIEDCDVHRFYDEWLNYKRGQVEQTCGMPIREWPGISASEAEDLAHDKVYTVEALAGLNDSAVGRYLSLRQKARDYLKAADRMAQANEMRAQLEARDTQLRSLNDRLGQLTEQLAAAQAAKDKPPAPKGKARAEAGAET